MAEPERILHISSAVLLVQPAQAEAIAAHVATWPGVDVHACRGGKIIITIEGPTTGMLGNTLTQMNLLDGVLAANMVFEHVDKLEDAEQ